MRQPRRLDTLVYCCQSMQRSMERAAGSSLSVFLTCPPTWAATFDVSILSNRDLIIFKLHGLPSAWFWEGDHGLIALDAARLQSANLTDATIFVVNCFLPESHLLQTLLDAGASCVVGGSGVNYGGTRTMQGADLLALYFRWALEKGVSPKVALRFAKLRLRLKWPSLAVRDTLAFRLWEK